MNKEELMLVRITGVDRPGLTAEIMDILSGHDVHIQNNIDRVGKLNAVLCEIRAYNRHGIRNNVHSSSLI